MADRPLNHQQMAFCAYLAADPEKNAKRAAIAAGYAPNSAEVKASKLLRLAKVRAEVDRRVAKQIQRIEFGGDEVLKEVARLAFAKMTGEDDGEELKPALRVGAYEKVKSLELLGKHYKLWTDKVEHSGKVTLAQLLEEAGESEE